MGASATNSGAVLVPMMLAFVVSAIAAGQIMSRTGRYKALILSLFAVGIVGAVLLARMDASTTELEAMRTWWSLGWALAGPFSVLVVVAQNAFPDRQSGRSDGGVALLQADGLHHRCGPHGVAAERVVAANVQQRLPAQVRDALGPERLAEASNPEALFAPEAMAALRDSLAALGAEGPAVGELLVETLRVSLADALRGLFVVTAVLMAVGFAIATLLPEIPLRKTRDADLATGQGRCRRADRAWRVAVRASPPRHRHQQDRQGKRRDADHRRGRRPGDDGPERAARTRLGAQRQIPGERHHDHNRDPTGGAVAVNQEVDRCQHGRKGRRADDGEAPQMCSESHRRSIRDRRPVAGWPCTCQRFARLIAQGASRDRSRCARRHLESRRRPAGVLLPHDADSRSAGPRRRPHAAGAPGARRRQHGRRRGALDRRAPAGRPDRAAIRRLRKRLRSDSPGVYRLIAPAVHSGPPGAPPGWNSAGVRRPGALRRGHQAGAAADDGGPDSAARPHGHHGAALGPTRPGDA